MYHTDPLEAEAMFLLGVLRALLRACGVPAHRIGPLAARIAYLIRQEVRDA